VLFIVLRLLGLCKNIIWKTKMTLRFSYYNTCISLYLSTRGNIHLSSRHALFVKLCWHMKNIKLYISFDMQRSKMIKRVVNGVQSFHQAIKLAPDAWTAMLIRTLLKPESQHFVLDVFSALANHSSYKIPETFWLCISRYLNYTNKHDTL
jgi:hypothetical protein